MPAHAVAVAEEAGAENVVGAACGNGCEHGVEVGGVVLAVAVEVDRGGVAVVAGGVEARAQRGPEAAAALVGDHARAVLAADRWCGVG